MPAARVAPRSWLAGRHPGAPQEATLGENLLLSHLQKLEGMQLSNYDEMDGSMQVAMQVAMQVVKADAKQHES